MIATYVRDALSRAVMYAMGFLLICVAVVNEDYGGLHWHFSAMLFLSLALFACVQIARLRSVAIATLLAVATTLWIMHFAKSIPPGAAMPEAVSIVVGYVAIAKAISIEILSKRPQRP